MKDGIPTKIDEEQLKEQIKTQIEEFKIEIEKMVKKLVSTKVDSKALDELEDQYSINLDQLVKTFSAKYIEKDEVKRVLWNMDRSIKLVWESVFGN